MDINLKYYMKTTHSYESGLINGIAEVDYDTLTFKIMGKDTGKEYRPRPMLFAGKFLRGNPAVTYEILTKDEAFLELI